VVGSIATIRYGDAFSWLSMVLVDPAYRRAGIGTELVEAGLAVLADAATVRLDATAFGHGVYLRSGFREEYGLQRMQRAAQSPTPAELGSRENLKSTIRAMNDGEFAEVLKRDRAAFGADRGVLVETFRREAPEYAWVAGEKIDGYVFGRHGYGYEHIGPLVADDDITARRLVVACVSAHPDRPFIIDVPLRTAWISWLESIRFNLQRPFVRMCRGEGRFEEQMDRIFAITGPEFG